MLKIAKCRLSPEMQNFLIEYCRATNNLLEACECISMVHHFNAVACTCAEAFRKLITQALNPA